MTNGFFLKTVECGMVPKSEKGQTHGRPGMKTVIMAVLVTIFQLVYNLPAGWTADVPFDCDAYSDRFDYLNISRWQEVLLYSDVQGEVGVENGRVVLRAHPQAAKQ